MVRLKIILLLIYLIFKAITGCFYFILILNSYYLGYGTCKAYLDSMNKRMVLQSLLETN